MFSAYKLNKQGDNTQPCIRVLTYKVMCLYVCVCVCVCKYIHIHRHMDFSGSTSGKEPTYSAGATGVQVRFLGQDGPLRDGMAPYSNILAWRVPWTKEPGGVHGVAKSRT